MRKVKTDRYQKESSPSPEAIDFSGPAIGDKPSSDGPPSPGTQSGQDEGTARAPEPPNGRGNGASNDPTTDPVTRETSERPDGASKFHNHYTIAVPKERSGVRHTFGIFQDQKRALDRLQMAIQDVEGEKPTLGEMVQEALDGYIQKRTRELPNVRTIHRTDERLREGGSDE